MQVKDASVCFFRCNSFVCSLNGDPYITDILVETFVEFSVTAENQLSVKVVAVNVYRFSCIDLP